MNPGFGLIVPRRFRTRDKVGSSGSFSSHIMYATAAAPDLDIPCEFGDNGMRMP